MVSNSLSNENAVAFRSISKSFGRVRALDDVSFCVARSSIHAIVGENGAGKSTLAKVLVGEVRAESGQIAINGAGPTPLHPRDAARRGVGIVHQEFLLARDLAVWENVVLGWEGHPVALRSRQLKARIAAAADTFGMPIPLDQRVENLPIALQQRVEIVKSLFRGAEILVLDEPTAVLTPVETQGLFDAMRQLRAQGKTLIFVSHKLKEVLAIADAITVMRAGRYVATVSPETTSERQLTRLIIGREPQPVERHRTTVGSAALVIDSVWVSPSEGSTGLRGCTFIAHRGEVLGIAGVSGNGQDELVDVISGASEPSSGSVAYPGLGDGARSGVAAIRNGGLGYVPADRGRVATAPGEPLWFSAISGRAKRSRLWRSMGLGRAREDAQQIITRFDVKADSVDVMPSQLSGGNLQRFILGREINRDPKMLVAYEPTRGIDIGAARQLRQRLRELAEGGAAVLLISSDLDELFETSDRMLVIADGVISADVDPTRATVAEIGLAMISRARGREDNPARTSAAEIGSS